MVHERLLEARKRLRLSYAPIQQFSYQLLEQNLEQLNPVLSPVSVYLAIGMAGLGSGGETLEEFRKVLLSDMMQLPASLMERLPRDREELKVSVVHSVWLSEEMTVQKEWLSNLNSFYNAEAYTAQLSTVETQQRINHWISQHTNGMISRILDAPLKQDMMMALFDTVYFKGKWKRFFMDYDTVKEKFVTDAGVTVSIDMMCRTDREQYIHSNLAEGIVLPYQGNTNGYSFVALLPKRELTVREMYKILTMDMLSGMIDGSEIAMVELWLPKFCISFERDLEKYLKNMGLRSAFQPTDADFSNLGISQSSRALHIGMVRQKVVFCLDEEGTEAAAVTDLLAPLCTKPTGISLHFDRPFLYMVIENESQVPLFMGIMDNPAEVWGK